MQKIGYLLSNWLQVRILSESQNIPYMGCFLLDLLQKSIWVEFKVVNGRD
jgi:hypothetical protein